MYPDQTVKISKAPAAFQIRQGPCIVNNFFSEHRNDKRTQRQEHDAEQGGQHDAAGGKLLIMVELDGEHRGDGCSRAAFQQQDDLRDHAVAEEPQRGESCDGQHRNEKHPDHSELPDVLVGEGAVQVA